ncbi:MAG TPA: alpha/beta hydrolase [Steroidobacteraceae bacterium]
MTDSPAAPDWFTKAVFAPCESRFVDVDGTPIHYLAWNLRDRDKPGLLFTHGFRAHARWWSFVAPFFLSRFRVVSMDFAGMGDSGARQHYSSETFSRDIRGVIADAGFERTTLVGHSFGGGRVARVCADYPELVERAVIIDSFFQVPEIGQRELPKFEPRPKNIYPTYEAARARFRLVPEENAAAPYVLDFIAQHSLKQVPGGWTWKFDEYFSPRQVDVDPATTAAMLERIQAPVTLMYGDSSRVVSRQLAHAVVKHLRFGRGPVAIPQSHHHVMLDQPIALIAALKAVLY